MTEWSSSYITELPDSAFACIDEKGRHYPHHDRSGKVDLPHLRNALSRVNQQGTTTCGRSHLMDHAKAESIGKAEVPVKATAVDDDHFRLLAFPFGGPLPSSHSEKGVDLDGQTFTANTDVKRDWLPFRLVDWHHGKDSYMGRTVLGKAVLDEEPDEDGWWVDVWLEHGQKRVDLIRKLAERTPLYGSSESVPGMTSVKAWSGEIVTGNAAVTTPGEILVWPYWRQTLSTSPQNTYSVVRPAKAILDEALTEYSPTPAFWADFADELRNLGADLRSTSAVGEIGAKAGRVLSSVNERDLEQAMEAFDGALDRLRTVLARHRSRLTQET